ncbi:C40 family peptidase [Anaerobium acetethylicum]|uniref:C40 family peptidase n=1 Tax=Anaerobium acetethylicum TaxID=1619234 RepID=UPI000B811C7B|nr:NlpC/P60 family protein [Anaerobium acetethylicum]
MNKLKIKKIDDKPIIIHIKKKARLHLHEPRDVGTKHADKMRTPGYTSHTRHMFRTGLFRGGGKSDKDLKQFDKSKKECIKLAGAIGAKTFTDQMEGGEDVQKAAGIAYGTAGILAGTASRGTGLFQKNGLSERKGKLKKVEAEKKIAGSHDRKAVIQPARPVVRKAVKEPVKTETRVGSKTTGTFVAMDRSRKLKFFLDKMRAEENQNDNFGKFVKDRITGKVMVLGKGAAISVLGGLMALLLLSAVAAIPVAAVIAVVYNSPFAAFLPPLDEGDTVMSAAKRYEADFNQDVIKLATEHAGYDSGKVIYVDYEGTAAPSNCYDVLAVYMVKYGIGDMAADMNELSELRLKAVFDDMCSYTTSAAMETVENEDGTMTTKTALHVNISLKTYQDMVSVYGFSGYEIEMLEEIMSPENLVLLGYPDGTGASMEGANTVSELSVSQKAEIVSGITDQKAKQAVSFALSKVGYPYSQAYRDSGSYYDCSSLAYYSWRAAGVDISFGGATTAAAEGQGLEEAGKTVTYEELQPGDLIFYSYCSNGRYKDISHVAVYAGSGKVVEAANERIGVVYRDVPNPGSIVLIGRP